ncbi:unnamed protein product [Anisakis simplex]|uniref:AMP_N domain-containing protein n=1 Tax=Anisakis simplex TaxID=6269 RepID=A0A0M3J409_ANISI|nr:unnamed protein product [Anisakis simplex]
MKRRPQSEPRAPQRRAHPIEVHRSRSPMRTLPPLQRGLTSERLRAHDKALQKLYDRPTAAVLTKGLPRVMV